MLRQKLLTTDVATYTLTEWDGVNRAGWDAYGDLILVLPDLSAETAGALGKIQLPEETKARMTLASISGIIVAAGDDAFKVSPTTGRPLTGRVPKVGDRVLFKRYSGEAYKGDDDVRYIIMSDRCVGAIKKTDGEAL